MSDILLSLGFAGVFFGAILFRGIFGYLKNQKIATDGLNFSPRTLLRGSIRPIAVTVATGALVALILGFLQLIGVSGLEIAGLEEISIKNIELGLAIADLGALVYAVKEMLLCFGLSEKQIEQIRDIGAQTPALEILDAEEIDETIEVEVPEDTTPVEKTTEEEQIAEIIANEKEIQDTGKNLEKVEV